jgi:hypothetical protein
MYHILVILVVFVIEEYVAVNIQRVDLMMYG